MSRTVGSTTTDYFFAGNQVIREKQGSTTTRTYTYGNALVREDGETPLFDGQGSLRTVTNSSQNVTYTRTYNAFGLGVYESGAGTYVPNLYAGAFGYRADGDGDPSFSLVGARYYDPLIGRFLTRDTVLSEHPYLYCDADPVNRVDPSGHDWMTKWLILIWYAQLVGNNPILRPPTAPDLRPNLPPTPIQQNPTPTPNPGAGGNPGTGPPNDRRLRPKGPRGGRGPFLRVFEFFIILDDDGKMWNPFIPKTQA